VRVDAEGHAVTAAAMWFGELLPAVEPHGRAGWAGYLQHQHWGGAGVGGGHEAGVDGWGHGHATCRGHPSGGHPSGGHPSGGHPSGGHPSGGHPSGGHPSGNGHTTGGHGHGLHFLAWFLEGGLRDGVVLGHEIELDHVVLGGLDALGGVDEARRAADSDLGDGCQYAVLRK